jgi:hypothetical protein
MKKILTAALVAFTGTVHADDVARVNQFSWMTGCWSLSGDGNVYEEVWLSPTGNNMLGVSRRMTEGYTREFEYLRIVTSGGGGFDFIQQTKGEPPVKFNMLENKGTRVVFDNPDNVFPQRISYEFKAPDQLIARYEGKNNGMPAAINFPMKRKSCEQK